MQIVFPNFGREGATAQRTALHSVTQEDLRISSVVCFLTEQRHDIALAIVSGVLPMCPFSQMFRGFGV